MIKNTLIAGLALIVLAFGFFFPTGEKTALIPAFPGIIMLIFAGISVKASLRPLGMHLAAGLALLGVLSGLGMPISGLARGKEFGMAEIEQLLMGLIFLVYLFFSVQSFIAARKARKAAANAAAETETTND